MRDEGRLGLKMGWEREKQGIRNRDSLVQNFKVARINNSPAIVHECKSIAQGSAVTVHCSVGERRAVVEGVCCAHPKGGANLRHLR